ncbi:MAG: hypothetical protein WC503_03940 [Candidatus Shapirobacteria bacterium]
MGEHIENKGRLIILTGPSGGGKDRTMNELVERYGCSRVVTCCAGRPIRVEEGEQDGIDYHFLSIEEFKESDKRDEFLEWFPYYETLKGTKKGELQRAETETLIWRIDPKTAVGAKDLLREKGLNEIADNAITIYIGVPDLQTLPRRQRLRDSATPKEVIFTRMRGDWQNWKEYSDRYDFVVINKDGEFDNTINQVLDIITRVPQFAVCG